MAAKVENLPPIVLPTAMPFLQEPLFNTEVDLSLQDPRAAWTRSSRASGRSSSEVEEAISLVSLNRSTQHLSIHSPVSSTCIEESVSENNEGRSTTSFHLLPKLLRRPKRRRKRIIYAEIFLLLGILGASGFGSSFLFSTKSYPSDNLETDCDGASASGTQRAFLVDIYIAQNLSFTRAKILDLAWDTIIGQGMKFFHAWLLYYVITRCLTATMEIDPIPYNTYLYLQLSTVSLSSLWSSARLLSVKRPFRVLRLGLWLIFEIAYVLGFAVVWSATTGYISGSRPTYAVSGIPHVTIPSPELSLCWVLDDTRLAPAGGRRVIKGPQAELKGPFNLLMADLDPILNPMGSDMDEFMDIFSYFLTKATLQALLGPGWLRSDNENSTGEVDLKSLNGMQNHTFNSSRIWISEYFHVLVTEPWKFPTSVSEIGGWQMEHAPRVPPEQRVVLGNLNGKTNVAAKKAKFLCNNAVATNTTRNVPYNSTIWLDGEQLQLPAPFLNTSSLCSDWLVGNRLELCICYNGNPVNEEIDRSNPTGCISSTGYSWGFASRVTGVAVVLELVWIATTWIMWTWANRRSKLISMHRTGAGTLRNILDTAEAITAHLGDQHSAYTEQELTKQLESSPPYAYVVESRRGVEHIGLRPIAPSEGGGKEYE
ncbi:hypothetical protein PG995_008674 [Apiospora arundinis]